MSAKEEHENRAEDLRQQLERHNRLYYVENAPEISDREFDGLMQELLDLEGYAARLREAVDQYERAMAGG